MKQLLVAILSASLLLSGCTAEGSDLKERTGAAAESVQEVEPGVPSQNLEVKFGDIGDPALLKYVEDSVFASTTEELSSDDYVIEGIVTRFVSQEYLEELNFNSQENIYFGYKLSDIEAQFEGPKYVFALDENGETEVKAFEAYDDTFDQVLKNVAIGSGVILICVTVSVAAGTVALPAAATVSTVFAVSASTGATVALTSGALGAIVSGTITGFETGDVEASLKSAALGGSESFKWGAITGVISGGIGKALQLQSSATSSIRTPEQSELNALKKFGGSKQKSYLNGKVVPYGTPGSTRPDIVREVKGGLEAIEVKNYNLEANLKPLARELKRQVAQRMNDLPEGMTQRIVLDAGGRGYSRKFIREVRKYLSDELGQIYPKIPIEILR